MDWWLWRTIYLSKLPRFEKKFCVALDWTLDLIFSKDLVQFLDIRAPHDFALTGKSDAEFKTARRGVPEQVREGTGPNNLGPLASLNQRELFRTRRVANRTRSPL